MKNSNTYILCLWACLCFALSMSKSFAQLTVQGGFTAEELVEQLVGIGIQVSNVTIDCPDVAYGMFNGEFSDIGINEGVILTSGDINLAPGPNDNGGAGIDSNLAFDDNDPDLDELAGASGGGATGTHDACVLEFDLVPYSTTLSFNYVFGSEEYLEYVDQFNDIFAFFISGGTEYPVPVNIALVPGTLTPVSINNVNLADNAEYFVNNPESFEATVQYDGFTTVLSATATVTPCQTYHLKLAIADAFDSVFDSGVFLEANSLTTNYVEIDATAVSLTAQDFTTAVEGCVNGLITFSSDEPLAADFPVEFSLGGSAVQGIDYTVPSTTAIIPAGQTSVTVPITVLEDNAAEGAETISITFVLDLACGINPIVQNVTLGINDAVPVTVSQDVSILPGENVELSATGGGGVYSWTPTFGLSNANSPNPIATPITTTTYTATSLVGECTFSDQVTITVQTCDPATDPIAGVISLDNNRICAGNVVNATAVGLILQSPEDVQVFVLHTSATNDFSVAGTILGFNTTGTFENLDAYPRNIPLYITSIAGDDDGTGFPNLTDPCISISSPEEFVFLLPLSLLINEYCDWQAAPNGIFYITSHLSGGLPAYDPTATYTLSGDINSVLSPNQTSTQSFEGSMATQNYAVNVIDGSNCTASAANTFVCYKTAAELLSYTGEVKPEGNLLKWTTISETNSDYYTLLRSTDGVSFKEIATVDAAGNSIDKRQYTYTDRQAPVGIAYYRLKQTDFNGKVNDLGLVNLTRSEQKGLQIANVSPIPTTNVVDVTFLCDNQNNITLTVYDITGRVMATQATIGTGMTQQLTIDMGQYSAGTYFLVLNDGMNVVSEKIIKIN